GLLAFVSVSPRFKSDAVYSRIHLGHSQDLFDAISQRRILTQVDRFAAKAPSLLQTVRIHVADDDDGRAEQTARLRACEADRTRAGDVNGRPGGYARRYRAVIAGGENIRKQSQILDLLHRLRFIRKLQQVEIGIGTHHIIRLSADPTAHIDVSVGGARPGRIYVQADAGLALFAIAASTA